MLTRSVGSTGIAASVIGLGSEHLDNNTYAIADEVIGAALDRGINIMDLFMPGAEVRANIGRALTGRREQMLIQGAIGSVDLNQQYDISRDLAVCQRYFEDLLRHLKTDYIDFGMLFYLDSHAAIDKVHDNGIVEYALKLKRSGKIRAIGASTHNPDTAIRLVKEGVVEMLMFSINPAFDMMTTEMDIVTMLAETTLANAATQTDPKRAELYRLCESQGVGITVMKSLAAGKLLSAEHSPFTRAMTPAQCIHYALTRPAVASVLVGCRSRAEVEAAVGYLDLSDAQRDYSQAISTLKAGGSQGFKGHCVYCNHCLPCPANINIAAVNKYLDIALLDENHISADVRREYLALATAGADCIACGSCEERCPFGVNVIANMQKAATLFG